MMEYAVEKMADVIDEIVPLLTEHWKEIAHNKDKIKLNPDYDRYYELEKLNMLHIVTARDSGDLVGYFISFISPHIHYSDHVYAVNDILYIDKAYRGRMVGIKIFKFAEAELKKLGVSVIILHVKADNDFGGMLKRIGYDHVEHQYGKYIGD